MSFTQKSTIVYHIVARRVYREIDKNKSNHENTNIRCICTLKLCYILHADNFAFVLTITIQRILQVRTFQDLETMQLMAITRKVHWQMPGLWYVRWAFNDRPLCGWCPGSTIPDCISVGKASFPSKSDPTFKYLYCISIPFVKTLPCHMKKQ